MMAWAQAGVFMTHGSQAQYDAFPNVPISDLQPGDLVFFGSSGRRTTTSACTSAAAR